MKKLWLLCPLLWLSFSVYAQSSALKSIRDVLQKQEVAWNAGDIKSFMEGYWHSDSLLFIGKSGPKYGWQNTLDNYIKSYPDVTAMGKLSFDILKIEVVGKKSAFVVGKWHLQRSMGDLGGCFTLFWKKMDGHWLIVADHSS